MSSMFNYANEALMHISWDNNIALISTTPKSEEFDQYAYAMWAADKLRNELLCAGKDVNVIDFVEAFAKRMDRYACKSDIRFSIAYDVAMELLVELSTFLEV